MRTVRCSGRLGGGGCLPRGVCLGRSLPKGVCSDTPSPNPWTQSQIGVKNHCLSATIVSVTRKHSSRTLTLANRMWHGSCAGVYSPPPPPPTPCEQNDACENIAFPQLLLRAVKSNFTKGNRHKFTQNTSHRPPGAHLQAEWFPVTAFDIDSPPVVLQWCKPPSCIKQGKHIHYLCALSH